MGRLSTAGKKLLQDDSELLYMSFIAMLMAAIFAANLHENVDRTLTRWAPAGSSYPFPAQTRLPAAKFTAALGGFLVGVFFWTVIGKLRWNGIKCLLRYREWLTNPRSLKTKTWYYALSSLLPKKRFLYTFQHVLPKYPLPLLETTCKKMLVTVEPLVNENEFAVLKKDMEEFQQGEGQKLHRILETRYETENNWVADLWDKYAYLAARTPLYYSNFCNQGGIKRANIAPVAAQSQCSRAASLVYHYMKFYQLIESRTIPPLLVKDLVPICTYRYRYVYACTRVPGVNMDELKTYEGSKHIIVMRKGIMYRVEVIAQDTSGQLSVLSGPELMRIFEEIIGENADVKETVMNPAVLTTQDRSAWAKDREKLLSHSLNQASLHDVESAVFHLVLEDTSPQNIEEECASNLCGDGFNRWLDKSLTIPVYENGVAGGNVEHTTADATLASRILEYVWGNSKFDDEGNPLTPDALTHPTIKPPVRLEWDLAAFTSVLPSCLQHFSLTFKANMDIRVLLLHHGKGALKKLRVSPDSFIQMALQLAFYRLHKSVPKTYETAMTRFFKYGRTETIRTVSKHSVAFTKTIDEPSVSRAEVAGHLKEAFAYHHNYKLEAMNGQAADRHMFGLYIAAKFAGIKPKLFEHKILTDYDQLSTSQSPFFYDNDLAKTMDLYPAGGAFPALREDGYGVYYLFLGDDFMSVNITSYKSCKETDSSAFGDALQCAVDDMKKLLAR